MVKINWSGLAVFTAVALGSALGLAAAPVAQAQDARAPMVRMGERPDSRQRGGAVMVRIAQPRGGAGQRQTTGAQRASALAPPRERREDKRPAQMRRDAPAPTRERGEVERADNGARRSR